MIDACVPSSQRFSFESYLELELQTFIRGRTPSAEDSVVLEYLLQLLALIEFDRRPRPRFRNGFMKKNHADRVRSSAGIVNACMSGLRQFFFFVRTFLAIREF